MCLKLLYNGHPKRCSFFIWQGQKGSLLNYRNSPPDCFSQSQHLRAALGVYFLALRSSCEEKMNHHKGGPFSLGRGRRALFSTIERSTGPFSQIFPAASCTKNLEFRFEPFHYRITKRSHEATFLLLAGAEGLEPSARGFGDRCSTN